MFTGSVNDPPDCLECGKKQSFFVFLHVSSDKYPHSTRLFEYFLSKSGVNSSLKKKCLSQLNENLFSDL